MYVLVCVCVCVCVCACMCFVCVVCEPVCVLYVLCVCLCVFCMCCVCEPVFGVIDMCGSCTLEKGLHVWVGSLACHIIATLSLLIVAGLGLCKVCIGLSG